MRTRIIQEIFRRWNLLALGVEDNKRDASR